MTLKDRIVQHVRVSTEESEKVSKDLADKKMFETVAKQIAKVIQVSLSGAGRDGEYIEDVREAGQGTILGHLFIERGIYYLSDLFCTDTQQSPVIKAFMDKLIDDEHAFMVFKVAKTGTGNMMWCMYLDYDTDTPPGRPRVVIFNKDYNVFLTALPLSSYLQEKYMDEDI